MPNENIPEQLKSDEQRHQDLMAHNPPIIPPWEGPVQEEEPKQGIFRSLGRAVGAGIGEALSPSEPKKNPADSFIESLGALAVADAKDRDWTIKNDPHAALDDPSRYSMTDRMIAAQSAWDRDREKIKDSPLARWDLEDAIVRRLPVAGNFLRAGEAYRFQELKKKIQDNTATSAELWEHARYVGEARERANMKWY